MSALERRHPAAVFLYFAGVMSVSMLSMNPVLLTLSLLGGVLLLLVRDALSLRAFMGSLALFLVLALVNPLVSHRGATVLFVLGDSPVTLEAVYYGAAASGMIVAMLTWGCAFSGIMTSDKLMDLFGRVSPKLALLVSMALRSVSLFSAQTRRVRQAQKGLGLYKEDNAVDALKSDARVFSILVTWALENGVMTADSMAARGYGSARRVSFSVYRFRRADVLFSAVSVLLTLAVLYGIFSGRLETAYYPRFAAPELTKSLLFFYGCYGALALLPALMEGCERIKWRCLLSKI